MNSSDDSCDLIRRVLRVKHPARNSAGFRGRDCRVKAWGGPGGVGSVVAVELTARRFACSFGGREVDVLSRERTFNRCLAGPTTLENRTPVESCIIDGDEPRSRRASFAPVPPETIWMRLARSSVMPPASAWPGLR